MPEQELDMTLVDDLEREFTAEDMEQAEAEIQDIIDLYYGQIGEEE